MGLDDIIQREHSKTQVSDREGFGKRDYEVVTKSVKNKEYALPGVGERKCFKKKGVFSFLLEKDDHCFWQRVVLWEIFYNSYIPFY